MKTESITTALYASLSVLQRRGVRSLAWIDPNTANNRHPVHLLVEFQVPVSYKDIRRLTEDIAELIQHPVELVLVDRDQPAVAPYLDPDAIVFL